jgi:hypothetical protein
VAEVPLLKVVRGNPTAEELAVLVAVFSLIDRPLDPPEEIAPCVSLSPWSSGTRTARDPLPSGPDAWRSSGWAS